MGGGNNGNGEPWIVSNQTLVAEFFGVPRRTVEEWRKVGMPGQRAAYNLATIYRWIRSRETKVVDSDALEWHRREKAKIAQLERRKLEGELVRVKEIRTALAHVVAALREAGDRLQRQFGAEAGDLHNEAIDAALGGLERMGSDSSSDTDSESAGV